MLEDIEIMSDLKDLSDSQLNEIFRVRAFSNVTGVDRADSSNLLPPPGK